MHSHVSKIPDPLPAIPTPKQRADETIMSAEKAKEKLLKIPGKKIESFINQEREGRKVNLLHSVIVDEEYTAIASHVDDSLRRKIILGAYIDLVRLLPRDWVMIEEEQCMEIVNGGVNLLGPAE